jgi:hypothetical protein
MAARRLTRDSVPTAAYIQVPLALPVLTKNCQVALPRFEPTAACAMNRSAGQALGCHWLRQCCGRTAKLQSARFDSHVSLRWRRQLADLQPRSGDQHLAGRRKPPEKYHSSLFAYRANQAAQRRNRSQSTDGLFPSPQATRRGETGRG